MAIELSEVLRRRPDVRFRIVDGEAVVLRQSAAEVMVFNDVAARILDLADGKAPVDSWIEALLAEYEVERETLAADVLAFAAELLEQGLLEPACGARSERRAEQPAGDAP